MGVVLKDLIMEAAIANLVQRLETVTARLEKVEGQLKSGSAAGGAAAPAAAAAAGSGAGAAWVGEFDNFYNENIPNLVAMTDKIGNAELKAQVAAFDQALKCHREFLNVASKCKKPDDATLGKLLTPTSKAVGEVISIRDSNRGNALWNHLSALSEGVPSAPAASAAAPPPGPPPPAAAPAAKKGPDVNALFSEINKGTGISSGLKKVTADMKTKNRKPEERSAVVKAAAAKTPAKKTSVKKGTPKFQLEGNKWVCEFQDDNNSLVIEETEPKHTVYLYKNDNCVVNVKGNKINSICIDSCNKCGIV